jgi:hypothetical protein
MRMETLNMLISFLETFVVTVVVVLAVAAGTGAGRFGPAEPLLNVKYFILYTSAFGTYLTKLKFGFSHSLLLCNHRLYQQQTHVTQRRGQKISANSRRHRRRHRICLISFGPQLCRVNQVPRRAGRVHPHLPGTTPSISTRHHKYALDLILLKTM